MRVCRSIVLLLSLLALTTQVLAGGARAPAQIRAMMTLHMEDMRAQAMNDSTHMDCCDPDSNKKPCEPDKDGTCLCKLNQGCQSPQFADSPFTLAVLAPSMQLMPSTRNATLSLPNRASRLLRPPIR